MPSRCTSCHILISPQLISSQSRLISYHVISYHLTPLQFISYRPSLVGPSPWLRPLHGTAAAHHGRNIVRDRVGCSTTRRGYRAWRRCCDNDRERSNRVASCTYNVGIMQPAMSTNIGGNHQDAAVNWRATSWIEAWRIACITFVVRAGDTIPASKAATTWAAKHRTTSSSWS